MSRGFSLVELSIVLVILGLLTGGILAGQSLIRAAELRATATESQRYVSAFNSFRDKYFALPGDMTNATKFWGQSTACSGASATGTCDGDGNGSIGQSAGASTSGEIFQLWRQLALAGLVEGNYTGISGTTAIDSIPATNVPASKLGNAGWSVYPLPNYAGDGATYRADYGNQLIIGLRWVGSISEGSAFKPEEAWNIDTKMDDGKPGTGRIMPRDNVGFGVANGCTTSSSNTDYAGEYRLSNSALACSIKFLKAL